MKDFNFNPFDNVGSSWHKNASFPGHSSGFSQAAYNQTGSFGSFGFSAFNQFKFSAAKSIRTSTIILAAFNVVSAFATAAGIYYDCYTTSKRLNPNAKTRDHVFRCVRGPETYPFILSLGITIQGITFAVLQSYGLEHMFLLRCSLISQLMWAAIFIVPYTQLVFVLEVTFRSLRSTPFPSRGKWTVVICLVIVKILLVGTGLVGFFIPPHNFCFASLFWYAIKWSEGGFILLLTIAIVLAICGVIIFIRLSRHSTIETSERISASRTVFYIVLAVISNALILPFFASFALSGSDPKAFKTTTTLAMISTVVANVTGLMTGGLHLFLRSNTIGTIAPKDKLDEYERQQAKYKSQMKMTRGMDFNDHILQPVSKPQSLPKNESQENLIDEKGYAKNPSTGDDPNPLRSNAALDISGLPQAPEPAQVASTISPTTHSRKPSASYTLFPSKNQANKASAALLPSTAYIPNPQSDPTAIEFPLIGPSETLKPPPSYQSWGRHRRNSSQVSSATVQIGLRLSNIANIGTARKPSSDTERPYVPDFPGKEEIGIAYQPRPLATSSTAKAAAPPSSGSTAEEALQETAQDKDKKDCTLSPAVFNPNSPTKAKTPSPRGVGFSIPKRANTSPMQGTPAPTPSRNRGNSSGASNNKSEWI
ncbi:hypothetical protein GGR52DRAFT_70816 [Hypoxylon sp. FL1284]|nr:hypothetical protein GGR52DRAFT_70816 [Hypoxylon sp. FL1284]